MHKLSFTQNADEVEGSSISGSPESSVKRRKVPRMKECIGCKEMMIAYEDQDLRAKQNGERSYANALRDRKRSVYFRCEPSKAVITQGEFKLCEDCSSHWDANMGRLKQFTPEAAKQVADDQCKVPTNWMEYKIILLFLQYHETKPQVVKDMHRYGLFTDKYTYVPKPKPQSRVSKERGSPC